MSDHSLSNFRSAVLNEPRLASSASILRTPFGNIRSTATNVGTSIPPPLPPSPYQQSTSYNGQTYGTYNNAYASPFYGLGAGGFGYNTGNYGGGYFSNYGSGYGGFSSYNRFGMNSYLNPNDPENQFIQLAEESSRPAFQSIESLVAAIGNIAAMLDSTFFAITSSFRAILGVAANFGRLRGVFAQFWQTFAIFRGLSWIYKKFLYWLRLSKIDPSTTVFKEAFAAATSQSSNTLSENPLESIHARKTQSPWPILAFLSFIFTAPYIIMKLIGNVANSAREESRNPKTWINPIPSQVVYDFNARNPTELTIRSGQSILIAPKEVQNTQNLLNTGWALATIDNVTSGVVPISYIQGPHQARLKQQQLEQQKQIEQQQNEVFTEARNKILQQKTVENDAKSKTEEYDSPASPSPPQSEIDLLPITINHNPVVSTVNHDSHNGHSSPSLNRRNSLPVIPEVDGENV